MSEEQAKSYRQLEKRIAREKQLLVAQQKMELKRILQVQFSSLAVCSCAKLIPFAYLLCSWLLNNSNITFYRRLKARNQNALLRKPFTYTLKEMKHSLISNGYICRGTKHAAPVYKWKTERKR